MFNASHLHSRFAWQSAPTNRGGVRLPDTFPSGTGEVQVLRAASGRRRRGNLVVSS